MTRITTTSRASVVATGHTGLSLQVRPGSSLTCSFSQLTCRHLQHPPLPGVLLGLDQGNLSTECTEPDATLPWLYLPSDVSSPCPIGLREVHILAKQGKSLRYQLWSLDSVAQSNEQLRTMDPQRASDGTQYVVPQGGVEAGLAGQAVLLHTRTQTQ
ncbi:hypothetical protein PAMP_018537 [Pampus punctatissimus]